MKHSQYQKDLNKVLESEIFGRQLFSTAARISPFRTNSRKWTALEALEQQTLERLIQFLDTHQQQAQARPLMRFQGKVYGLVLALLPWKLSMKLLEDGTQPFMEAFERLQSGADQESMEFFLYVLKHEQAIAEFAALERRGQPGDSLAAVHKLLGIQ